MTMAWIMGQLTDLAADRRGARRAKLCLTLDTPGSGEGQVRLLDIAQGGMMLHTDHPFAPGDKLLVELPEAGAVEAVIVWRRMTLFGCRFVKPINKATLAALLLRAESRQSAP
jgi:PilZ domain